MTKFITTNERTFVNKEEEWLNLKKVEKYSKTTARENCSKFTMKLQR